MTTILNTVSKNPSIIASSTALVGGLFLAKLLHKNHDETTTLESQFGTSDGYFPSAKPGAHLAKMPGNSKHVVGEHYVSNFERLHYNTKHSKREQMELQRKKTLGSI